MELQYRELDNRIRVLKLIGKLDIVGVGQIETRFADYCAGEKVRLVVDLSGVDFLASIGIRMLTVVAKSVSARGGRMVMARPSLEVHHVLDVTGIPAIVPIYPNLESAQAALLGSSSPA